MNSPQKTVGDFICERRKALRISQQKLAERMSEAGYPVKQQTVSDWEGGGSVPARWGPALAEALELEPTQIERLQLLLGAQAWHRPDSEAA